MGLGGVAPKAGAAGPGGAYPCGGLNPDTQSNKIDEELARGGLVDAAEAPGPAFFRGASVSRPGRIFAPADMGWRPWSADPPPDWRHAVTRISLFEVNKQTKNTKTHPLTGTPQLAANRHATYKKLKPEDSTAVADAIAVAEGCDQRVSLQQREAT